MTMKAKALAGVAALLLLLLVFISVFYQKLYQLWDASIVTKSCEKYYRQVATGSFSAVGNYDSDGNGSGTCTIYVNGVRAEVVECPNDFWFNTNMCKPSKNIFSGADSADQTNE